MSIRKNPFEGNPPHYSSTPNLPALCDTLRVAEKRNRNRQWEKGHLTYKAMYRGVDPQLALQVKQISETLLVTNGEVARALLEYALRAYALGELELEARPNPLKMRRTLFPAKETSEERRKRGGMPLRKKKEDEQEGWRVIVTWRGLPPELKQEIIDLASGEGLNVPAGELVTALLRFSLKAYEYGLLKLEPIEIVTGYSLYGGNS
jgi:hypothetical protein